MAHNVHIISSNNAHAASKENMMRDLLNSLKEKSNWDVITTRALADLVEEMLMVRAGETITQEIARERANNIAAGLMNTAIADVGLVKA